MSSPIRLLHNPRGNAVDDGATALNTWRRDANFLRLLQTPVPATRIILGALVGVFVAGWMVAGHIESEFGALEDTVLPMVVFGAKINNEIAQGDWWRLITHTMIHGGWLHLVLNGYGLYLLGTLTERLFGTRRFIVIYGVAGLAGAMSSYLFNEVPSVGASGAIYGVFGAVIVFGFKFNRDLPERVSKALSTGLLPWLAVSLAFGLLPMVDNAAHFGGLFAGSAVAAVMRSPVRGHGETGWRGAILAVLCIGLAIATIVSLGYAMEFANTCTSNEAAWSACREVLE